MKNPLVAMLVFKIAVLTSGTVPIVLGFLLLEHGVFGPSSDLAVSRGESRLTLANASPGALFALFGAAIIAFTVFRGFSFEEEDGSKRKTSGHGGRGSGTEAPGAKAADEETSTEKSVRIVAQQVEGLASDAGGTAGTDVNALAEISSALIELGRVLSARILAAQPGEGSKGFGVAAEVVRSPAERAKEAAAKSRATIRSAMRVLTEVTASSAQQVTAVEQVVAAVTEVTASSAQQVTAVEQVVAAVEELSHALEGVATRGRTGYPEANEPAPTPQSSTEPRR